MSVRNGSSSINYGNIDAKKWLLVSVDIEQVRAVLSRPANPQEHQGVARVLPLDGCGPAVVRHAGTRHRQHPQHSMADIQDPLPTAFRDSPWDEPPLRSGVPFITGHLRRLH